MPSIQSSTAIIAQFCPAAFWYTRIRIKLIGSFLTLGIPQLGGIEPLDHYQWRFTRQTIEDREVIGAQGHGLHRRRYAGHVDRPGSWEQICTAVE